MPCHAVQREIQTTHHASQPANLTADTSKKADGGPRHKTQFWSDNQPGRNRRRRRRGRDAPHPPARPMTYTFTRHGCRCPTPPLQHFITPSPRCRRPIGVRPSPSRQVPVHPCSCSSLAPLQPSIGGAPRRVAQSWAGSSLRRWMHTITRALLRSSLTPYYVCMSLSIFWGV